MNWSHQSMSILVPGRMWSTRWTHNNIEESLFVSLMWGSLRIAPKTSNVVLPLSVVLCMIPTFKTKMCLLWKGIVTWRLYIRVCVFAHNAYCLCIYCLLCSGMEQFMERCPEHVNMPKEDDGHTALHIAAANNHLDLLRLLASMVRTSAKLNRTVSTI